MKQKTRNLWVLGPSVQGRRRAFIAFGLVATLAAAVHAQDADQLKNVEQDLARREAERTKAAAETTRVARELDAARAQEVSLAKEIQDQEESLSSFEARLSELETEGGKRSDALTRRDAQLRATLMALERLALHPADALSLSPLAPDDAVRAAILLRAAVPAIGASTTSLKRELTDLSRTREEITAQQEKVAAGAAALVTKRAKLATMIAAKADQQAKVSARGQALEGQIARLSKEAEDLRALFAKLAEEKTRREAEARKVAEAAAAAAAKAQAKADAAKDKDQASVVLKAPPGVSGAESGPPRLFSKARGTLPFPAVGKVVAAFGESAPGAVAGGLMTRGLTIATRPAATVVSPFDGTVAFAGPFRGYGELLIIEHSEGYHTLLAGLGRIDATLNEKVLAGEPVGSMSNDASAALYVELRHDGQPINPLPWLARRKSDQQSNSDRTEPTAAESVRR